jgi:6,7-dimethyl-8-ribityllumazine synthase
MAQRFEGSLNATGLKFAIVHSRYNDFIVGHLVEGALDALSRSGAAAEDVDIAIVPGSFELPLVARKLAETGKYNAVICLSSIIRGATAHFDYVAAEAAKGIAQASLQTGVPVIFGVVTAENLEQAIERAGTKMGNRGFEAARAAIEMANLIKQLA